MEQEEFDYLVHDLDENYGELRKQEDSIKDKRDKVMQGLNKIVSPYGFCRPCWTIIQIPYEGAYFYSFRLQYSKDVPEKVKERINNIVDVHKRLIEPIKEYAIAINANYKLLLSNLTFTKFDEHKPIPVGEVNYTLGDEARTQSVNLLGPSFDDFGNTYFSDFTFPCVEYVEHMIDRLIKEKLEEICNKNIERKKIYAEST